MPEVTGKVTRINIKGYGQNSGHLQFVVGGEHFLVTMCPEYEPQVFIVMANLVISAFNSGHRVTVNYKTVPREANRPTEIEVSDVGGSENRKAKKR